MVTEIENNETVTVNNAQTITITTTTLTVKAKETIEGARTHSKNDRDTSQRATA